MDETVSRMVLTDPLPSTREERVLLGVRMMAAQIRDDWKQAGGGQDLTSGCCTAITNWHYMK